MSSMIVDAFLAGKLPQNGQQQATMPNADGFLAVLNRANDAPAPKAEPATVVEKPERARPSQTERRPKAVDKQRPKSEAKPDGGCTDDTAVDISQTERNDNIEQVRPVEEERTQAEETLKQELAETLDIPVEKIEEVLAALGMQLTDLLNPAMLSAFMQAVYETESPVELLSVPDIGHTFTEVNKLLETFNKTMPSLEAVDTEPDADLLADLPTEALEVVTETETYVPELEQVEVPAASQENRTQTAVEQTAEPVEAAIETVKVDTETDEQPVETAQDTSETEGTPAPTLAQQANADAGDFSGDESSAQRGDTPDVVPVSVREAFTFAQRATRTAAAAMPRMADSKEIVSQLLDRMRVDVRGGVSEVRITLQPESLGDVTMRVMTQNGVVTAHFVAQTQRVKEVIEANLEQLKETLAEQGIDVSELNVEVSANERDRQMAEFLREQQRSSGRIKDIINQIASEEEDHEAEPPADEDSSVDYRA